MMRCKNFRIKEEKNRYIEIYYVGEYIVIVGRVMMGED